MNFIDEKGFNDLQSSLDERAQSEFDPSFMAGSAGALFNGAANGFAQVASEAQAGGYDSTDGASALFGLIDSDPSAAYPGPEKIRENAKWASDTLRPDPQTTGTMAQVLFGVGDVGARFATGFAVGGVAGGAALSGGSVGKERYDELIGEGVDPKTALGAASIRGIVTGAGALLPAGVGGSLLTRVASGVGINTTAGIGGRAAESKALEGYKQGDEIQAFAAQDIAVDAILGGIFGGVSRLGIDVSHDQYDAALALKNAKSFNMDAMPGVPESVGDIARHGKLMDAAIDDIINDRAVSVDAQSGGVKFAPREDPSAGQALADGELSYADIVKSAFDEQGYGRVYEEMTQAEARAAQIDRSQSQFAFEDAPEVVEPTAFKSIQSESFRDLLPGDRVTTTRDMAGLRAGEEVHVNSVDEQGAVHFSNKDGKGFSVPRAAASDALDVGLNIRRPVPDSKPVPTEFGKVEPADDLIASADRAVEEAATEGRAYDAAIDCFLSRGN
ncbi:hypothetical protein ACYZT4_10945 [Pseudomonas sp. GB2N2]